MNTVYIAEAIDAAGERDLLAATRIAVRAYDAVAAANGTDADNARLAWAETSTGVFEARGTGVALDFMIRKVEVV